MNRLVIKQTPGHVWDARYAYDLRGLQTKAWFVGTDWGVFNDYDGFGRATSTTTNMAGIFRTISRQFDRDGRRVELAFPDGEKFWTRRDGLGRAIEHYQGPLGSTATFMAGFAFDAASHMYRFSRRFGSASVYEYDPAGRLSVLHDGFGWGIGDTRSNFTYNPASQLTSENRTNDAYAWTGSVATNRGYATNGQNQYTGTTTGSTFGYDANGNLTSVVNPPLSTTYTYDSENRLVSASGSENANLLYDPLGRLFQVSTATGLTQFLYDGDELIAEYGPYGVLLRRYVHGDKDDDPLYWYEGAGLDQPRFPHTNHQGSVVATAGLGGAQLWINTYDEYGIPGADNKGRFGYTGQTWMPELGLWYYKARFYSPTLGRFLQVDPIGYEGGINLHAYVRNDPINKTDPTGLADLNLVRRSDKAYDEGENADFPGAFTIFAHSGTTRDERFGVEDQRGSGHANVLNPRQLLAAAQAQGYHKGGLTLLISCSVGTLGRPSYAQEYANRSEGRTVASPGVIGVRNLNDTTVRMSARLGFYAHDPHKQQATYLGNKIVYDSKTGYGTISTERTGSRMMDQKRVCLSITCEK